MTLLGKTFLLVNLALSLVLATLAFGVYANGIDWSNNAAKAGQPAGRYVAKKAEIDDLLKGIQLTYATWHEANRELLVKEEQRRFDRRWYAGELEKLEATGPVLIVAQDKGPADAAGHPTLVPAMENELERVPLQTRKAYQDRMAQIRAENDRIRKELEAKVEEDRRLTNELTGDPERKTKGLRRLLTDERTKQEGLIAETGIEESLRINREVESELILKRLASINERVRELEAFLKFKAGGEKKIEGKGDQKKIEKKGDEKKIEKDGAGAG